MFRDTASLKVTRIETDGFPALLREKNVSVWEERSSTSKLGQRGMILAFKYKSDDETVARKPVQPVKWIKFYVLLHSNLSPIIDHCETAFVKLITETFNTHKRSTRFRKYFEIGGKFLLARRGKFI